MYNYRNISVIFFFLIITFFLLYRAVNLMLGAENINRADLIVISRTPNGLTNLSNHIQDLEKMSENIDDYSLGEIRKITKKTTTLINVASIELKAQQDSWEDIRVLFNNDTERFQKLKKSLDSVQHLNNIELVRVKKIIEEVNKPTFFDNFRALFISFLLGLVSSLIATYLYSLFKKRKK